VEREAGNVFVGFKEGFEGETPPFEPTYKFQPKTSLYERRPDKKFRAPAWCDRILWHARDWAGVKQRSYEATMTLEISDHKPVSSVFDVRVKAVEVGRKRDVYAGILRELDKYENDAKPQVELTQNPVSLGLVRYGVEARQSVFMINTSTALANWHFTPKHGEQAVSKRWLGVEPSTGILVPGQRAEIIVRALVDNTTAVVR